MVERIDIGKYRTLVFDCDGVILNSNHIKTEAFRRAAAPYGNDAAEKLVEYHVANGGVSRYRKFDHFLGEIIGPNAGGPDRDQLLARFAAEVKTGLMNCEQAAGLAELRGKHPDQTWMVVSGGDQNELREVFAARGLAQCFDGGIFGSPDLKEEILWRELTQVSARLPAVYLGDSRYDFKAARLAKIDFMFVSDWSEVAGWKSFIAKYRLSNIQSIRWLLQPFS